MPYARHVYHVYAIRTADRAAVQSALDDQGIQTGIHYPTPVHLQQAYAHLGYRSRRLPPGRGGRTGSPVAAAASGSDGRSAGAGRRSARRDHVSRANARDIKESHAGTTGPDHRRGRAHRIAHRRCARPEQWLRRRHSRQFRAGQPAQPGARHRERPRHDRGGRPAGSRAARSDCRRCRRDLSPGSHPHHAVRAGTAAGDGSAGRRHLLRARGGRAAPGAAGRRGLVGVGLRHGGGVSHHRRSSSLWEPHAVRRGEALQRRPAAQLSRHVRPELRGAALLQRVRAADGRPRGLHRSARAMARADRRRTAADDFRRRHPDDGLRARGRYRPGQHPGRECRRRRRGHQHRHRPGNQPQRAGAPDPGDHGFGPRDRVR